jgi:hypothetical protein
MQTKQKKRKTTTKKKKKQTQANAWSSRPESN